MDSSKSFETMNQDLLRFNIRSFTFNIFVSNLFLFVGSSDLSNYADGSTLHKSGNNLEHAKQTLRGQFQIVTKWFYKNYILL